MNRGAVGEGIREDVGDDGAEEATKVGNGGSERISDSASEADGFEWFGRVVKGFKGVDAGRVGFSEITVKGVKAAVEAGAGVQESWERGDRGVNGFAETKRDSRKVTGDRDGNGTNRRGGGKVVGANCGDEAVDGRLGGRSGFGGSRSCGWLVGRAEKRPLGKWFILVVGLLEMDAGG